MEPPDKTEDLSDDFDEAERRSRRKQFAIALLVLLLSLVAIALRIRGHRHLTQMKSEIRAHTKPVPQHVPVTLRPGGQDPLLMARSPLPGNEMPEFLTATAFPGRGMGLFQITAAIPGLGEVPLLDSPSLDDAAKAISNGTADTAFVAPFTLPWAGRIPGSSEAATVTTQWNGRSLSLPATQSELGVSAVSGLLFTHASDSLHHDVMPDGDLDQAAFTLGDFGSHWPSKTQATVGIMLSGRVLDLTVTARNSGTVPEPIGIGWQPRFLLGQDRNLVRLHLPSGLRVEERANGEPTGRLVPVEGTAYDFTAHGGAVLGDRGIDASFVHLRSALLDSGPMVELIEPERGYGLRITALSSNIRSIRIYAPADRDYISVQPNFNYDDPFGREWPRDENTGMVTLQPGQTVAWRIRLELFSLDRQASQDLYDIKPATDSN